MHRKTNPTHLGSSAAVNEILPGSTHLLTRTYKQMWQRSSCPLSKKHTNQSIRLLEKTVRNNIKVSYSCTQNNGATVKNHTLQPQAIPEQLNVQEQHLAILVSVWDLKEKRPIPTLKWSIIPHAKSYTASVRSCQAVRKV